MRNLIALLACFALLSCQEFTASSSDEAAPPPPPKKNGLVTTTNSRTKVKNEVTYKDGVRQGPARSYYPNGKLWKENNFVDGKLDGVAQIFFRNGKVKRETNYSAGKRDGKYTEYFKSGNPKLEVEYLDDRPLLTYKDRDYKGELADYPSITYTEKETLGAGGVLKVYTQAKVTMPDGSSPRNLQLFLLPKEVNWNSEDLDNLGQYQMKPSGDDQAFIELSLEQGQYIALDGVIVATFDLKKGLEVAYSRSVRLSYENL